MQSHIRQDPALGLDLFPITIAAHGAPREPVARLLAVQSAVAKGISALIDALLAWQERARQRRELLSLGDRALQDFGASRADAAGEGDKPFWRA
ncbi:MAG TPA: DUF1127 domain-containing protein [Dongiaceae bacterium]|jgi:uncharacterized protein YjiS (DUF1127 family)